MELECVIISHVDWVKAAESEHFDAYEDNTDNLEKDWGLVHLGFADEDEDSFVFLITDKSKWFLAKIKHGF